MLREATIDDLDGIIALAQPWLAESGEDLNFSVENFTQTYLENFAHPDIHLYVLEYDGAVTGLGVISVRYLLFQEKIARLEWFYIHECMRGTGAGLKLARFLRDLSVNLGARIIIADTIFTRYARVFRNMFKKLGFEEAGYTMIYRS